MVTGEFEDRGFLPSVEGGGEELCCVCVLALQVTCHVVRLYGVFVVMPLCCSMYNSPVAFKARFVHFLGQYYE